MNPHPDGTPNEATQSNTPKVEFPELEPLRSVSDPLAHLHQAQRSVLSEPPPRWVDPELAATLDFLAAHSDAEVLAFREAQLWWLTNFCDEIPAGPAAWPWATRFKRLLEHFDYSDPEAADLCDPAHGAPLVGVSGGPAHWPEIPSEIPDDPQVLLDQAARDSGFFTARIRPSKHDQELWDVTADEVASGKTLGPFRSYDALTSATGGPPVVALRFGVQQTDKLRPCDDLTAEPLGNFHVNRFFATSRKLRLSDLGVIGWWSARLRATGRTIMLWKRDHKSAYRQIPIKRSHRRFAAFGFCCPASGRKRYFCPLALPFGATAAVPFRAATSGHQRERGDFPSRQCSCGAFASQAGARVTARSSAFVAPWPTCATRRNREGNASLCDERASGVFCQLRRAAFQRRKTHRETVASLAGTPYSRLSARPPSAACLASSSP